MNKHVAIVTLDYAPDTGGVAVFWNSIMPELPEHFIVVAPKRSDARAEKRVIRIPFLYKIFWPRWLRLLLHLVTVLKKYNINTIIAAQVLPVGTVAYLLCRLSILKRYSVAVYGMDLAILKGRKKKLARKILQHATTVIANSAYTQQLVRDLGIDKDKIVIAHPSAQVLPDTSVDIRDRYTIGNKPVLLSVGRLVERKGIDTVIQALPRIWKACGDVYYLIVGEGSDQKRLEKLVVETIPAEKQSLIIFAGRVASEELKGYYQASDIFVLPTRTEKGDTEGFGMVNIEASMHGLPVVAGPVSEQTGSVVHEKTGLITDPINLDALANSIICLLENEDLRDRLGAYGKEFAKQFTWQQSAEVIQNTIN